MQTNHLTIEQAAELVKSSVGDVFSREAVLSILDRIKTPENVDMLSVKRMVLCRKGDIQNRILRHIESGFDELVDYESAEFRIEGSNEIVLDSVCANDGHQFSNDLAENIVDIIFDGCYNLESTVLIPKTTSDESSEIC